MLNFPTYLEDETVVDVLLSDIGVEILALDEAQEELVDDLNMGPSNLQNGLVFLRIEGLTLRIHRRGNGAEQVLREHLDHTRIHALRDDLPVVGDVVKQLMQGQALDLLRLHVSTSIVEVEDDVALINLLHEQILPLVGRNLVETRELFQLALALIRDVETRRVLSLGSANPFSDILRGSLQAVEEHRLAAGFGWKKISRHGFSGSRRGYVLG